MRKLVVIFTLVVVAVMALAHLTPLGEWNPVRDTVDTAVTSVVNSQTTAETAQCRAIQLATGSADDCAVLMTPAELEAAVPAG